MTTQKTFLEDAICMYALATAYLHNAVISDLDPVSAMSAKEMAPGTYYVWRGVQHNRNRQHIAPVAICTCNEAAQIWKIELISGEKLMLRDKGNVWEIAEKDEMLPNSQAVKRPHGAKRGRSGGIATSFGSPATLL